VRYSTAENWAKYFKETELVQIYSDTIRKKLREAGINGITGIDKIGRVLKKAFFSESDVRTACADLLQPLPQADETGFFIRDGERYGTIGAFSKVLRISPITITHRIKTHKLPNIKGKDKGGRVCDFYSESVIRKNCVDILQLVPEADENGFFEKDGQRYGTVRAWSKEFEIADGSILLRIKTHNLQNIKGKDKSGKVCDFYSESVMREICADLLQPLPEADENGFFMKDKQKYGTIRAWSKFLGISATAIIQRIKTHTPQSIKGKDIHGCVRDFYPESVTLQICADLLQNIPWADEVGFFMQNGERYGLISAWSQLFRIPGSTIRLHIKSHNSQGIKGKDKGGRIFDFYSETAIREICADLLKDTLQADEDGFFEKDGQKYATKEAWARSFGISASTISSRIKTHNPLSIKGKDKGGNTWDFYPESAIHEICADILAKRNPSTSLGTGKLNPKAT